MIILYGNPNGQNGAGRVTDKFLYLRHGRTFFPLGLGLFQISYDFILWVSVQFKWYNIYFKNKVSRGSKEIVFV